MWSKLMSLLFVVLHDPKISSATKGSSRLCHLIAAGVYYLAALGGGYSSFLSCFRPTLGWGAPQHFLLLQTCGFGELGNAWVFSHPANSLRLAECGSTFSCCPRPMV